MSLSPYRPLSWNDVPGPAVVMIDFPGAQGAPQYQPTGIGATLSQTPVRYIFDCVILVDHEQRLRKTEHPVQTGAAISDHAFIEPARLSLDVGMSDAMDEYMKPPSFAGQSQSKSVNAYQTMILLMFARQPLTITTRLRSYDNMIIENVHPQESAKSIGSVRMRIEFGQVFRATVTTTIISARGQDTIITNGGSKSVTPPTDAQRARNSLAGAQNLPPYPSSSISPGLWGSNDVNNDLTLPASK